MQHSSVEHVQIALHNTFVGDDGADSCVGPIFHAVAG